MFLFPVSLHFPVSSNKCCWCTYCTVQPVRHFTHSLRFVHTVCCNFTTQHWDCLFKVPRWSYVYWTVHHLNSWITIDQLDVTCFIISLFIAQHVSNVSTSIFRSLRLIVDLFHVLYCSGSMCDGVTVWFGWGGVVSLCRLKHSYYFTIYCSTCFEC